MAATAAIASEGGGMVSNSVTVVSFCGSCPSMYQHRRLAAPGHP
jgi:hypothetical protein